MTTPITPPPENDINAIQNIPDVNKLTITDLYKHSKELQKYNDIVISTLKSYISTNDFYILPGMIAIPLYQLQTHGFLTPKSTLKVKIKFGNNFKAFEINTDGKAVTVKKTRKLDEAIANAIKYDISDLPPLAELLANVAWLTEESIKKRIEWLEIKEINFKTSSANNMQPSNIEGQIKYLLKDLLEYYKNDYELGWPKLVRLFLLGYTMELYYETEIPEKIKNKKNNANENTFEQRLSLSTKSILNVKHIKNVIINSVNFLTNPTLEDDEDDYNSIKVKKEMTKNIRSNLKFAYLLFYFVKIFGYISLISPATPNQSELLKYFKYKDFAIMEDNIKDFRKSLLGENIVTLNLNVGSKISKVVLEYAKNLAINDRSGNDKKFYDGLNYLKNNYLLLSESREATISETDSNYYSEKNNKRSGRMSKFKNKQKNDQAIAELKNLRSRVSKLQKNNGMLRKEQETKTKNGRITKKSNKPKKFTPIASDNNNSEHSEYSNTIYNELDEDEKSRLSKLEKNWNNEDEIVISSKDISLIFEDYSFETENNQLDLKIRNDMQVKIRQANHALNKETLEDLENEAKSLLSEMKLNYSEEDNYLIARYKAISNLVKSYNVRILSEYERKTMKEMYQQFVNEYDKEAIEYFEKKLNEYIYVSKNQSRIRYFNEEDIKLICANDVKDMCLTGDFANEFYSLNKLDGDGMELDDDTDENIEENFQRDKFMKSFTKPLFNN
jgi:hypothetical protein